MNASSIDWFKYTDVLCQTAIPSETQNKRTYENSEDERQKFNENFGLILGFEEVLDHCFIY